MVIPPRIPVTLNVSYVIANLELERSIYVYLIYSKHAEVLPITHLPIKNVEKFLKNWGENLEIT